MKRVMCLYRVSTKGQVDPQDDIPMQRRECQDFINRQSDWKFAGELMEKGVSGYKISAQKRDAIQEMRSMAERKEFDVLLVFMFDRLGRREDETPFLVQWFIEHGIEVWSTREGQQRIDSRADKLINYIRYWQAGGESEKTSMRVKAAHAQMTSDGLWRGGNCPYGYKLVHNGRLGKKNRPLYDMEISEPEGRIVQEIFNLCSQEGYGALKICNLLNRKYPDSEKVWTRPTVMTILKNPVYTGRLHMNDVFSQPIDELRIVSDEEFQFVKHALESRIPRKYTELRDAENKTIPDAATKTSVYGASLLSGIIYCGHCHHKLVGGYCIKQRKNGPYYRPIYRCYNGSIDAKQCDGQSVYSAKKIEPAVIDIVHKYFASIRDSVEAVWKEQAQRQKRSTTMAQTKKKTAELEKLKEQKKALEKEIMKSLTGESVYEASLLNSMLTNCLAEIEQAENAIIDLRRKKSQDDDRIQFLSVQYKNITEWAEQFDDAGLDEQRMMLAHLIDRIEVDRDYHISVHFYVALEDFQEAVKTENVSIFEADRCYFAAAE